MATQDKVSYRYGKAFFDLLKNEPKAETVLEEFRAFGRLITKNSELKFVVSTPAFKEDERHAVVGDVLAKMKVSELARRMLLTLSDLKRLGHLDSIVDRLTHLFNENRGVVLLEVRAASDLEDSAKKGIEQKFGKVLGKEIEARYEVDPALIGGLRIVAGGRTYDGSVDGWLTSFEERLIGGTL